MGSSRSASDYEICTLGEVINADCREAMGS